MNSRKEMPEPVVITQETRVAGDWATIVGLERIDFKDTTKDELIWLDESWNKRDLLCTIVFLDLWCLLSQAVSSSGDTLHFTLFCCMFSLSFYSSLVVVLTLLIPHDVTFQTVSYNSLIRESWDWRVCLNRSKHHFHQSLNHYCICFNWDMIIMS